MIPIQNGLQIIFNIFGINIAGFAVTESSFATYESDFPDVLTSHKKTLLLIISPLDR